MTPPTLFVIFMLCSPDLLTCTEELTVVFTEGDRDACQESVTRIKEHYNKYSEGQMILFGKCVWRIVKEER